MKHHNRKVALPLEQKLSDETKAFVKKLAASGVWLLALGLRGATNIPDRASTGRYDDIAARRIDVSEIGANDSFIPLNYRRQGRQVMPFFSSRERAMKFVDGFPANISLFQPYAQHAGFIATPENEIVGLVLDPDSPDERTLTEDERLFLRAITSIG